MAAAAHTLLSARVRARDRTIVLSQQHSLEAEVPMAALLPADVQDGALEDLKDGYIAVHISVGVPVDLTMQQVMLKSCHRLPELAPTAVLLQDALFHADCAEEHSGGLPSDALKVMVRCFHVCTAAKRCKCKLLSHSLTLTSHIDDFSSAQQRSVRSRTTCTSDMYAQIVYKSICIKTHLGTSCPSVSL